MRISLFLSLLIIALAFSNVNSNIEGQKTSLPDEGDALQSVHVKSEMPTNLKPVFGYRFVISGDFDGDGKDEKMIEHFYSGIDNKETNKFYDSLAEYDQLVTLTIAKDPISFVISENENIDTLHIAAGGQLLGLSYCKNEGDLNGDGTDEISYVVDWADWSSLNTWHIVSYKNNEWTELYSFDIWDWQLPNLPETFNDYGLFGLDNKIINTTNDSVNDLLEAQLLNFPGLVKKVGRNKIQVIYRNEEAMEDSMVVNLNGLIK
ncbi:MAG: hypothetical protein RL204_1021 [Bacteroidota bacterium]|jgi:hypothetical protein